MNNNKCCLCNILEVINVLQCKSEKIDDIPNTCDRPFLGFSNNNNTFVYNTRPVALYNRDNTRLTFPYTVGDSSGISNVFRIEKVNGCCATFRILRDNPDTTSVLPYVATDNYFTLNCNCICAISCLPDTFVDCL